MTNDPLRGNKVEIALSSHPLGMSGFPLRTELTTTGSVDTFKSVISCVWTFLSGEDSPQEIARFYPLGSSALCLPLSKYMSSCFLSISSSSSWHELGVEGTSGRGILQPPCSVFFPFKPRPRSVSCLWKGWSLRFPDHLKYFALLGLHADQVRLRMRAPLCCPLFLLYRYYYSWFLRWSW